MANRHKPLPWRVRVAQAADAALTQRPTWEKWPLPRQLNFLFSAAGQAEISRLAQPHTVLAELRRHLSGCPADEHWRIAHLLRQLALRRTALFARAELVPALVQLGRHYPRRQRELSDWQPTSKNPFRQLDSLVRHLFDSFGDVPAWLMQEGISAIDRVWDQYYALA